MTDFIEKIRLRGQAEEDQYFARRDRELIEAIRRRQRLPLIQIRSGGQTGADRGALEAVLAFASEPRRGIEVEAAGWCPRGRLAEDGTIDERFPLRETPEADFAQRTEWNVRDADATLILHRGPLSGGTALTARCAERLGKPLLAVDLGSAAVPVEAIREWLQQHRVRVLNVAGPRESEAPGIADESRDLILRLLRSVGIDAAVIRRAVGGV
jgi:hypothetical protein